MDKPKKKMMSDMVVRTRTTTPPKKIQEEKLEEDFFIEEIDETNEPGYEERSIDELIYHYGDKRKSRFGCVVWVIALGAIIALVFAVGGLFTHASIMITPKIFSGTIDDSIILSQTRSTTSIQVGMATKDFKSEITIPATGQSLANTKSSGTVAFYNATTSPKTIPAGTIIVSSKQISYSTNKSITIPKEKSATIPGQVTVLITAVTAGDTGNDALDDFTFAKPTTAEKLITIHGTTVISGGATGNESMADPVTLAQAESTVTANLSDQSSLDSRLAQELPDDSIALPLVIPLATPIITIDGTQSDGVHVTADRSVSILIVNRAGIANALGAQLNVPSGTNVVLNSWDGLIVTSSNVAQNQTIPQIINIRVTGTATVVGDVSLDQIKSQVVGLSRSTTKKFLTSIPEISSYSLSMMPPWRFALPSDLNQISVSLKQ